MRIVGDSDETLFFIFDEFSFSVHEIAVALGILAPNSSSELMELRESEFFWIDNNNGIGREEIYPILDNGGSQEDIVFSFFEGVDSIFDLLSRHLTMSDNNTRLIFSDTDFRTIGGKSTKTIG
jgi:hypothetical protein